MINRRSLLSVLGVAGLVSLPGRAAAQARPARSFNGLTSGVGDLFRLSRAKS